MIQIESLATHLDLAPTLARWHADEWSYLISGWGFEAALAELSSHTSDRGIPMTLVAMEHGELLGSVSLIVEDLRGWEHLTPWLASVFVRPAARSRGVARALVGEALRVARAAGCGRLHLFTAGQADYYRALGWFDLALATSNGHPVTVMAHDL